MDTLALALFQWLIFQLSLLLTLNPPKSEDSPLAVPVESDHNYLHSPLSWFHLWATALVLGAL